VLPEELQAHPSWAPIINLPVSVNTRFYTKTRKPCCRKETARCWSYSFRFNVRQPSKLNQTKRIVFNSRFEWESILSV